MIFIFGLKLKNMQTKINILITATDYAKRHNISRVAVNNWIKEGRVRAVYVGKSWLIEDTIKIKQL